MSASLDTLPAELLYKIFQVLDRETKLSISLVSFYCRAVIHSLCWQALNTKAKELRFDPVQLRSWGWEEEVHNFLSCNCIDIHLDFKPFRSSEPVMVQEVRAKKVGRLKGITYLEFHRHRDTGTNFKLILIPGCFSGSIT